MLKRLDKLATPANALVFACICIILGAGVFYKVPDNPAPKEYKVELEGKIVEYPDVRADKTILVIEPTGVGSDPTPVGRVRVSVGSLRQFSYGEYIIASGTIKEPENFVEGFNWPGYLAKEGIKYEMRNPKIQKTGRVDKDVLYYAFGARDKLQRGINNSLLPPNSSLYSAMLLANKGGLTPEQKDNLASAGLSHIVAISGMHIAVILFILLELFLWLGFGRKHADILVIVFITAYILMVGVPASVVRAGIMAGVLVLATLLGRPNFSWRALVIAGAAMALLNPYIVRYDVGFQLSFLAVLGIILFYEKIETRLKKVQRKLAQLVFRAPATKDNFKAKYAAEGRFGFVSILAVTLAAQALTFPLIIYNFGSFSLVSPVTNILVIPILPFALVSGFGASVLPSLFSAPAWMFGEYIWWVVSIFS